MPSLKPDESPTPVVPSLPTVKEVLADEAAVSAEVSAAHAVVATEQAESDRVAAVKAASKATPACPHCGRRLRAENDLGGHLHCDSTDCVGCCFDPGEKGPVLRPGARYCPKA